MTIKSDFESMGEYKTIPEFNERQISDINLINRIKVGFIPELPSFNNPQPRVIDGYLTKEASEALEELYEVYEPKILKIVNNMHEQIQNVTSMDFTDLIQEGFLALFQASVAWDTQKESGKFLDYVNISVWGKLYRYIEEHKSAVKLPAHVRNSVNKYQSLYSDLENLEYKVSIRSSLANLMDVTVEEIDDFALYYSLTELMGSMDTLYFADNYEEYSNNCTEEVKWSSINLSSDIINVEEEIIKRDLQRTFAKFLSEKAIVKLSERSIKVVSLRYFGNNGNPMTYKEIASEIGISRQRVRIIESKVLENLRNPSNNLIDEFEEYLLD